MKFPGSAMLIRWWDGPPVIVLIPSSEPVRIRNKTSPIALQMKIPLGAIRGTPLTKERKQFLAKQGMDPELIARGFVFDVSKTLASQFDRERDASISLAKRCGLNRDDLDKILEAKKKLAVFSPSNRIERLAKKGLEYLLSSFPGKGRTKAAGRPTRITADERQELRERADKLEAAGQNRRDIVSQFSEEYELRPSYIRRILEDAPRNRKTS